MMQEVELLKKLTQAAQGDQVPDVNVTNQVLAKIAVPVLAKETEIPLLAFASCSIFFAAFAWYLGSESWSFIHNPTIDYFQFIQLTFLS